MFLGQVEKHLEEIAEKKRKRKKGISTEPLPKLPGFRMCCNSNIRRRQYKKTRVGRSTISGWGLFLLEDAKVKDFIMEYTGASSLRVILFIVVHCTVLYCTVL